jgi:hypothetical protein
VSGYSDVHVNEELVAGKWKERYVMEHSTTVEVLETIANVYVRLG